MKPQEYNFPADIYMLIGTVIKAQGLRGEVKIRPYSGQPENFSAYRTLTLVDRQGMLSPALTVTRFRVQGGAVILQFDQVGDRTHAEQLVDMGVLLPKDDLPALEENEFYWQQLEGLRVTTVDGRHLGVVDSFFFNGAQDVMVVRQGDCEYLIPLVDDIIRQQTDDLLVIEPPPGLLDINQQVGE